MSSSTVFERSGKKPNRPGAQALHLGKYRLGNQQLGWAAGLWPEAHGDPRHFSKGLVTGLRLRLSHFSFPGVGRK